MRYIKAFEMKSFHDHPANLIPNFEIVTDGFLVAPDEEIALKFIDIEIESSDRCFTAELSSPVAGKRASIIHLKVLKSTTYASTAATIIAPSINLEKRRVEFLELRIRNKRSNHVISQQTTSPNSRARKASRLYHLIKIPTVKSWNNRNSGVNAAYVMVLANSQSCVDNTPILRKKATEIQPTKTVP